MIVIHVEYRVDPARIEEFRDRVRRHAANSLAEPGCRRFDVAEDSKNPGRFMIWENYVDEDALDHHREQPSLEAFRGAVGEMTRHREVTILEMITPAGD